MPAAETIDLAQFPAWIERLPEEVVPRSFEAPLKSCATALRADFKDRFDTSTAPDGSAWAPLRFPRPNSKGADKPLRNTSILMASVSTRGAQGSVEEVGPLSLTVGTALPQAAVHQTGVPGPVWDGRPHRAKYLSIPQTVEAARVRSPRDFDPGRLFFVPNRKAGANVGGWLKEKATKGRGKRQRVELVTHFLLVRQVKIPARPFVGFSDKVLGILDDILAEHVGHYFTQGPGAG